MKFNVLMIPEKQGRNGHPKIYIHAMPDYDGYIVQGFCEDFGCQEINSSQLDGINIVLEKIFNEL